MAQSSRASRGIALLIGAAISAALSAGVSAHRLDEYLQTARIAIQPDRVHVELDLTPGVAVADRVVQRIDRDGDGAWSGEEQHAYARQVLSSTELRVDGKPLRMQLVASQFPDEEAVRRGEGTIRLDLDIIVPLLTGGRHQLFFRNANDPDSAVYLANALMPETEEISIARQVRDASQRELTIDVDVRGTQARSAGESVSLALAGAAVLLLPLLRRVRSSLQNTMTEDHGPDRSVSDVSRFGGPPSDRRPRRAGPGPLPLPPPPPA